MKPITCFKTYYLFFSLGFFFLSQNTLNLAYAQDVIVIIDDIESRLNAQDHLCYARLEARLTISRVKSYLKSEPILARRKDEIG